MNNVNILEKYVLQPLSNLGHELLGFIPNMLNVIFILLIGWFVAKLFEIVLTNFLKKINFDDLMTKMGILDECKVSENEKKCSLSKIIGLTFYWFIMIAVIAMALRELGLYRISYLIEDISGYILAVVKTGVILVLGIFLSMLCSSIILMFAKKLNMPNPKVQAGLVRNGIIVFTFVVCLMRLGLSGEVLLGLVAACVITFCLTFIIAFGIGGQAWAGKVLNKFMVDKKDN
ncbi:MAG: hypothetical protein PHP69_04815 [Candidatus Omnitrophica bacterium]|jgi:hypothetical protein|nr:hypothetical protein [Candidatus Omnitrophota bacterium]MDD5080399.1 hypothetical protein [Candidatus Omnitrophota bacterium]MDD5440715.1 hypothetical protein [Candidatus Omnitrophota bacterium]